MKIYQDSISAETIEEKINIDSTLLTLGNLYEPPPLDFSFETVGWKILAVVLVLGSLILAFFFIRRHIKNRYRREALQLLERMHTNSYTFAQLYVILKQVAIHTFGRARVGPLYGKEWLKFLEQTAKGVKMLIYESQLNAVIYRGEEIPEGQKKEILYNAKKWIKTHEYSSKF